MDLFLSLSIIMDRMRSMPTLEEIEEWRKANSISRQELAELLHVNYKALCPVLAGTRPLSSRLSARIQELMNRHNKGLIVNLPQELAPLLSTWAETAGISVDALVAQLLEDVLKIKRN